ncbi:MAG: TlpA family protein disulfide reductase, partial [Calditrichia bacterium]|nr:TlpA family protein disulfide reductase [Calditrichia bacterium]
WATWCGPCRAEIPSYVDLYEKYNKKGLEIIGVSLDRDGWTPVKPFMESYKINYPIVMGNMQVVQAYGGINSIPTTFIINRKGEVVERKIGARPVEYFEQILANLL